MISVIRKDKKVLLIICDYIYVIVKAKCITNRKKSEHIKRLVLMNLSDSLYSKKL